ncbi:hypothetical protein PV328_011663 [Microctonus aethiopoides]|uniref:MPN domain-containing protein n=1 Tax=Microctonus aethiopoides TaxID=144406 RepID=A0AA39EYE7_9HYME|nr:hypothetical protein PV328_011663 [Microctonus aethiopoides]
MEEDKNTLTTQCLSSKNQLYSIEPEARLRRLSDNASLVEVNPNIPPQRYFRSGIELLRMADVYMKEKSLENAYILYVKYLTLFLEKVLKHPQYNLVPAKDRLKSKETLRNIFPLVEQLKSELLAEYKAEAKKYNAEKKDTEDTGKVPDSQETHELTVNLSFDDSDKYSPNSSSDKQELRNLVMPTKLIQEFLNVASTNTINNRETCGILAGKLEKNKLTVTHLLIPKQSGSSDSCITHNEEEIFDYQDQHSLITLGWIHTHPTQTAFLSSVDLHTHCSYQLMMSEAVAIVCAPKYDETGYFTLTPDHGLNFVARCRATGFHPHPNEQSLYTHAQHCKLDPNANVKVVDLTKK